MKINDKLLSNNIKNKDILTANMSADVTKSATGDYVVTALSKQSQIGDKFAISGGNIVIGSGIKKVLIGGTCSMSCVSTSSPTTRNFSIRKNNSNAKTVSTRTVGDWTFISISDFILNVNQGDAIGLQMYTQKNDIIKGGSAYTYVTIKAVEYED